MSDTPGYDDQDQSEVFDEDNMTADDDGGRGYEFKTFEEIPDVLDLTAARGDGDEPGAMDEAEFDADGVDDEDTEDEAPEAVDDDAYDETDLEDEPDANARMAAQGPDEVELIYRPDVDGARGAQASAAHFESRGELNTDDLEDLGYVDKPEEDDR